MKNIRAHHFAAASAAAILLLGAALPALALTASTTLSLKLGAREGDATTQTTHSVKKALPDSWTLKDGSTVSNTDGSAARLLAPLTGKPEPASSPAPLRQTSTLAPQTESASPSTATLSATASTLGPNLVPNPSLQTGGTNAAPQHWSRGGYGTNTRTLTYPVAGPGGSSDQAISVAVSNYSSGDAKWYFDDVQIKGGAIYQFSDLSKANVPSIVTIRFKLSSGAFIYKDILNVPSSSGFISNITTFAAPSDAVSLTVFHLIKQNGTLVTDEYAVQEVQQSSEPPPEDPGNLVSNGSFESVSNTGLPAQWGKGGYGSNTRTFAYPVAGASGSGAKVTVTNYSTGDAKWYFDPVPVSAGATYTYSDSYTSSVPSILTAQYKMSDGTFTYRDLATLPASSSFTPTSVNFTPPSGAVGVSIFHLIKQNGSLTIDNVELKRAFASGGGTSGSIFSTGAVTFRFDDGIDNQYDVAAPKLESAGFKGTFYIVTRQLLDYDFSGYMSIANIKDLYARGHEIGSHTRTHPHLTSLSSSQQQQEIAGARQDILSWGVGDATGFAYPYGEYNSTTLGIVKNAGYTSAASTIDGFVSPSSDPYQLEYQEVHSDTSLAQVQSWVNSARANHTWLILTFHDIKAGGDFYSTTPTTFNNIVNYVKSAGIPVVTISQGMQSMP